MAEGDRLRRALGGEDPGEAGDLDTPPLGRAPRAREAHGRGRDVDAAARDRLARRDRLGRDVDHARLPARVEVAQAGRTGARGRRFFRAPSRSRKLPRRRAGAFSPASASSRSLSRTTRALARAWATTSAEPTERRGAATSRPPSKRTRAGRWLRRPERLVHALEELDLDRGPADDARALHAQQGGADEEVERHLGGDGVAGQAEHELVAAAPEHEGRARLDGDLREEEADVEAGQHLLDEVEGARGDAAGDDEHVGGEALRARPGRSAAPGPGTTPRDRASAPAQRACAMSAWPLLLRMRPARRRVPDVDELVAGDEDGDGRPPSHEHLGLAHRGQHGDAGGIERAPAREDLVARRGPPRPGARCARPSATGSRISTRRPPSMARVFSTGCTAVGARGHGRARHDLHGLARAAAAASGHWPARIWPATSSTTGALARRPRRARRSRPWPSGRTAACPRRRARPRRARGRARPPAATSSAARLGVCLRTISRAASTGIMRLPSPLYAPASPRSRPGSGALD